MGVEYLTIQAVEDDMMKHLWWVLLMMLAFRVVECHWNDQFSAIVPKRLLQQRRSGKTLKRRSNNSHLDSISPVIDDPKIAKDDEGADKNRSEFHLWNETLHEPPDLTSFGSVGEKLVFSSTNKPTPAFTVNANKVIDNRKNYQYEDFSIEIIVDKPFELSTILSLLPKVQAFLVTTSKSIVLTSRLLVFMVLAQRTFSQLYRNSQDWYMGHYIRRTMERMGRHYKIATRYQVPALMRPIGRLLAQLSVMFGLGRLMEWMVGLSQAPCRLSFLKGCHWWCGILWIVATTGPGHMVGVALSIWGYGLRLQVPSPRPSGRRILRRPWRLLRWMFDPDQWFREVIARDRKNPIANHPPFNPDWRFFPATWRLVRILQLCAVSKEMFQSREIMHSFMRLVLIQQAFGDEWFRVVMCEKQVALGVIVMTGYLFSTISIFAEIMRKPVIHVSSVSILLAAPSVVAGTLSAWMNVIEYLSRQKLNSAAHLAMEG